MRKADLVEGGEYAYARGGSKHSAIQRVKIVGFGVERRYQQGWSSRVAHDGILLAELDKETGEPLEWAGTPGMRKALVATSRELLRPWDSQVKLNEEARARREAETARAAEDQLWLSNVAVVLGLDPMDVRFTEQRLRDRVVISRDALEHLVSERMTP